ncbi:3'-5' exoribonuclease [Cobetia sp. 1AS1]|uniref:3'-5' exonuclease n=1 Tax=Cobetia sp. 1AS1 TaxID=3040016 RepID=UPI002449FA80|nr:3'-5' exoribonuclease [Cobetia sp. 1AS1]MDH2296063.1 3'-5' exoribonuclease [Cobetia sp. 1AS1]
MSEYELPVSIDLETLSVRQDARITTIGAAARVNGELETFVCYLDAKTSQRDRHIDPNTLTWWRKQGELYDQMMARCADGVSMRDGLLAFQSWYIQLGDKDARLTPWGNGSSFDVAMLEHAFRSHGMQPPWAFWMARDLRTLKALAEDLGVYTKVEREGTHHDARDDAIHQLRMIETLKEQLKAARPQQ